MVNPEEILQCLDEFSKLKPKDIPRELEEYLLYVAKTGDPVYQWSLVKFLFREKMLSVITDFYESCPSIDLPPCPNVDPFNYETMKANLLERLDSFSNAPFTVQRLCELLTTPRKEYTRVDKFMRAIEKNILVVSTKEPGCSRARGDSTPQQTSQSQDALMNGVMEGRPEGLDISEAIETVSADGVNLMHSGEPGAEAADVALAESIRVECADIVMEEDETTAVWHSKVEELKGLEATSDPATAVVWEPKTEEGEDKSKESCEPVAGESTDAAPSETNGSDAQKTTEPDEHEATAVAVVSEFLTPQREGFGQPVELGGGVDGVPLVLPSVSDSEPTAPAMEENAGCSVEEPVEEGSVVAVDAAAEAQEAAPAPVEQVPEAESKDQAASEAKEEEAEDASQVDAESGISCSPDTSASSDCATAEMNQTLETNGSLEITSVESEVMSPLEALEDVTANISPPSPDQCANLDGGDTPPPTFAEMTADEDTQDAERSCDADESEDAEGETETRADDGGKSEEAAPVAVEEETSMEVDETPMTMEVEQADEGSTGDASGTEGVAEAEGENSSEDTQQMPFSVV